MITYDVYVLSELRDSEHINQFINTYTDRCSVEDRGNEELMVLPIDVTDEETISLDDYDWIPAIHIHHVIDIGTGKPTRAFRFYLHSGISEISSLALTFTLDHKIIYGITIEIEDEEKSLVLAEKYLDELYVTYQGIRGGIFYEEPAPLHTTEFLELLESRGLRSI